MIGYTSVYIGTLERALIAYRANDSFMVGILEELRSEGVKLFDSTPLAKRRAFYAKYFSWMGFKHPERSEKLRSFDGYYGIGVFDSAFSSEFHILYKLARQLEVVDVDEFTEWYYSSEAKPYKELLTLFKNTQGDSMMLSPEGCKFINRWEPKYEC